MHLRCYRCAAWQHAAARDVPPIGLDVWVCRVCKADQHPRDGALAWQMWEWQRSRSERLRRWVDRGVRDGRANAKPVG